MKCIENLNEIKLNNTVVTIGKFDGIHKGHGKLFNLLKDNAGERKKVVLTFAAKPIDVINRSNILTIMTEQEKRFLCEQRGMDYYISLPLNKEFLDLTPEAFIKDVLIDVMDMSLIVCGPDFTFGKFGAGNTELLKKMGKYYGYEVVVVEKEQYQNKDIGSTEIRNRIVEGQIQAANEMLGHPFTVIGKVTEGKKLGRRIGFSTANIIPDITKILPPRGVYRTKVRVEEEIYDAISNIGINPTVEAGNVTKIETHIINAGRDIDLYNKIIEVQFYEFIRSEKKFEDVDELKAQIRNDIEAVKSKV